MELDRKPNKQNKNNCAHPSSSSLSLSLSLVLSIPLLYSFVYCCYVFILSDAILFLSLSEYVLGV